MRAPLRAFRLHRGTFVEAMVTGQRVLSQALGLEFVVRNQTLRLFDPRRQEFLRTPAEAAIARQQADDRIAEEAMARQEAEECAARLAVKLRELGFDPDQM